MYQGVEENIYKTEQELASSLPPTHTQPPESLWIKQKSQHLPVQLMELVIEGKHLSKII